MIRQFDDEAITPKEENENEETRLIIDHGGAVIGFNHLANSQHRDDVIGTVLNLVDDGDEIRRLSSHSPSSSISPQSLPVTGSSQYESENDHRSRTQSPGGNIPVGVDDDLVNSPILNIACGYLTARLYMDRFYCPGIHQLCIEYNGQFLTPKQFTIVAAKDKQKDWKGAIKINRQPVRILFERNLLDFYKHSEYCSGRCVSKSYKPLCDPSSSSTSGVEFIQQINNGTFPSEIAAGGRSAAEIAASFTKGIVVKSEFDDEDDDEEQSQRQINGRQVRVGNSDLASDLRSANGVDLTTANGSTSLMDSEPLVYWNCVNQLGLLPELTQEMEQQFQFLKTSFGIPELRPKIAKKLSEMVRILEIGDKIQQKLVAKRTYTKVQCALLDAELSELRKIAETQEKKQREVKRKSELLDHLIGNLQDQKRKRHGTNSVGNVSPQSMASAPVEPNPAVDASLSP